MLLTLKRFGFNDSFVNWVKIMQNNDIQTCVINNGWISDMLRNTRVSVLRYTNADCPFDVFKLFFLIIIQLKTALLKARWVLTSKVLDLDNLQMNKC
jgi:hypothetical protein